MAMRKSHGMDDLFAHAGRSDRKPATAPTVADLLALHRELDRLRAGGDPWVPISSAQPPTARWVDLWIDVASIVAAPDQPARGVTGFCVLAFYDGSGFIAPPGKEGTATHWKDVCPHQHASPPLAALQSSAPAALPLMAIPRVPELRLVA